MSLLDNWQGEPSLRLTPSVSEENAMLTILSKLWHHDWEIWTNSWREWLCNDDEWKKKWLGLDSLWMRSDVIEGPAWWPCFGAAGPRQRLRASQSISGLSWVVENNQSSLNFLLEQKHILAAHSNSFLLIQETSAVSRGFESRTYFKKLSHVWGAQQHSVPLHHFAMASDIPPALRHLKRKPLFTR